MSPSLNSPSHGVTFIYTLVNQHPAKCKTNVYRYFLYKMKYFQGLINKYSTATILSLPFLRGEYAIGCRTVRKFHFKPNTKSLNCTNLFQMTFLLSQMNPPPGIQKGSFFIVKIGYHNKESPQITSYYYMACH